VSAYESQSNAIRDQGVAFESKNWSGDVGIIQGAAEAAGPQVDRLKGWLDVNALQQAVPELAAPESDALEGMEPSRSPEPAVVRTEDQLMRLGIAGGDKGQAKKEDPSSSRRSRQNLAVQYQQDFRSAAGQIGALEAAGKTVQPERPGQQGLVEALQDGMQQFSRRDRDGAAGAAPAGRAERQAGLMSLEVELPSPDSWKWELLAFESPRSAVDLSGHAISRRAIQGWKRLATAAGAAVVAWFLLQAMRGRRLDPSSWLALCNLLVIAGLVGLLLGIFPTGSVVVAVGALVGRQRARRIMRAA
jgi:hypothetical protein